MRRLGGYAAAGLALLGLSIAALWPWLDGPARRSLLAAAAVAWPVQVVAFWMLVRHRGERGRFLAVWAGGTLVRMAMIVVVALALTRVPGLAVAPTLLGLAGFFFGLLLLEPVFFSGGRPVGGMKCRAGNGEKRTPGGIAPSGVESRRSDGTGRRR